MKLFWLLDNDTNTGINRGSDFETHCATVASLIKALVNNREELGTCALDLIIYVHAVSSPKLRRRFKRTSHDSRDPHHLNVLEHAGTIDKMLTVDYNYAVTPDQIHILDTADGFRCLLSLSQTERAWFRGQQPWSEKETEYPPPLINSYNSICDFLVKLESGELQPAEDNVGSFYYHFLQYAIALFSLYGDYISRIEKVTLLPDAPIGECLANFQRDVVCATKIADKVTELAWDSPMLKRVLSVLNLEMWKSKEQLKAIMDRKRNSSVVAGPSPLLGLDTTEDEQMQEPVAEEQTVTEDEEDELSNKDLEEDEDEYVETLGKKLITLKPVNMNEFEMAQKILLWMRLVTFQIKSIFQWEYTATSRRVKSPLLSLALIKPPIATHNTLNWCEYVKQLVPPEDSVDAAEALQHYATKSGIAKLQRVDSCHRHCEAMLASLVYVAKNNMKSYRSDLKSILPVLRGVPEIFGTSKRCCHICNTVIGFLCEDSAKFTMLDSHSSIYPYSLPPLLPPLIRKSIIDYYKKPLVDALVSLIAAYRQHKKLDERPRMRSLDSNPGFSSSDGSESEGEGIGQKKVRMPRRTLASILDSEKYLE